MTRVSAVSIALRVGVMMLTACNTGPRSIVVGEDSCHYCKMTIDDPRFGGQAMTAHGKIETFDSIECLVSFVAGLPVDQPARNVWIADYEHPSRWIAVDSARFVQHSAVRSPMGRELIAFSNTRTAHDLVREYGGEVLTWNDVRATVQRELRTPIAFAPTTPASSAVDTLFVSPRSGVAHPIADAVRTVARGGVVHLRAGVYAESTIVIAQPLTLQGDSGSILDGRGERELVVIHADSVIVRDLTFRNTGTSQTTDRAALHVIESAGCLLERNHFENTLFGIYLQRSQACLVRRNTLDGMAGSQTVTGNGIHLWASRDMVLEDNIIRGHRDGIYFEFVRNSVARRNLSTRSKRYGLHFMFSDSCWYEHNTFRHNESGVAVMYSKAVHITDNSFVDNRGSAAYGLLLKEITDSEVRRNQFVDNSSALHLEGASRDSVTDNDFVRNGWAIKILADAQENVLSGNAFVENVFDVGTNSRSNYSTFDGNYWDRYRGYDLAHDGIGDVPHVPVRLFALLVEQTPAALVLTRSILVDFLDAAERVLPILSPASLRDRAPLMHPPRRVP